MRILRVLLGQRKIAITRYYVLSNMFKVFYKDIKYVYIIHSHDSNRKYSKESFESLGLSRWVQVYSDQPYYIIEKSGVVIVTPASEGLCRYYEYVLNSMNKIEMIKGPTQEELDEIEEDEYDLNDWDIDEEDKTYH